MPLFVPLISAAALLVAVSITLGCAASAQSQYRPQDTEVNRQIGKVAKKYRHQRITSPAIQQTCAIITPMAEKNSASLIGRMPRDTRLWRWLFIALSAFPWLWLLLMALFALAVTIQQGQLPSYGQPDPKDTGLLVILYWPAVLLSVPTLLTVPIWLIISLTGRLDLIPLRPEQRVALLYITGLVLAAVVIVGDAGGLMTWLVD